MEICHVIFRNGFLIKTVKNVQIDPQATEMWLKQLNDTLSVSESVNDTLVREKLEF